MKLTNEDKALLLDWGYPEEDLAQIEEAFQKSKTKYELGSFSISREEALRLLGRRQYLSGIARSAFHRTAARSVPMSMSGEVVYFDSSNLFKSASNESVENVEKEPLANVINKCSEQTKDKPSNTGKNKETER